LKPSVIAQKRKLTASLQLPTSVNKEEVLAAKARDQGVRPTSAGPIEEDDDAEQFMSRKSAKPVRPMKPATERLNSLLRGKGKQENQSK